MKAGADAGFSSAIAMSVRVMTSSSSSLRFCSSAFSGSAWRPSWTVSSYRRLMLAYDKMVLGLMSLVREARLQFVFLDFRLQCCHIITHTLELTKVTRTTEETWFQRENGREKAGDNVFYDNESVGFAATVMM